MTKQYEAIFLADNYCDSTPVGVFDTYEEALSQGQSHWTTMCDNDHKWYAKRCYYLEIRIIEWNDENECYDYIETLEQIDVNTL